MRICLRRSVHCSVILIINVTSCLLVSIIHYNTKQRSFVSQDDKQEQSQSQNQILRRAQDDTESLEVPEPSREPDVTVLDITPPPGELLRQAIAAIEASNR